MNKGQLVRVNLEKASRWTDEFKPHFHGQEGRIDEVIHYQKQIMKVNNRGNVVLEREEPAIRYLVYFLKEVVVSKCIAHRPFNNFIFEPEELTKL
jgi:hypothetical protein